MRLAVRFMPAELKVRAKRTADHYSVRRRHYLAWQVLHEQAKQISESCLCEIECLPDWQRLRQQRHTQLVEMLGMDRQPERGEVPYHCTGIVERSQYRIEKIVFESQPGLFVTANLYLPSAPAGPLPCVVYLNGHWPSLDGAKTGYQNCYQWYPRNGFALLVIDPMGYGEIPGIHHGTQRLGRWHWTSLGYTPAAVELWNAMRAVDWLEQRPEVDSNRIGVTGISGGGVMTQYLTALDQRIKVAAASCSTFTVGHQVTHDLVRQQCDCSFFPNIYGWDFPDVLALIAPRPLLLLGGRKDPIFPPAGFRAAFHRVQSVYKLYPEAQATDRIRLVESNAGHTDPPAFLQETWQWFSKWLEVPATATGATNAVEFTPETPQTLRVCAQSPVYRINEHIDDLWYGTRHDDSDSSGPLSDQRVAELENVLKRRVFRWLPKSTAPFNTKRCHTSGGMLQEFVEFGEFTFDSEPGAQVLVRLLKPRDTTAHLPVIVYVRGIQTESSFPDLDEFYPLLQSHAVAVLTPRFAERSNTAAEYTRIQRSAMLCGRTIVSQWVWDVLRTLDWLTDDRQLPLREFSVYGSGEAGVAGLYAGLLNRQVDHVILRDPPASHRHGAHLPTILRDTDLGEIAGLLAPRRLTFLGPSNELYVRAAQHYSQRCVTDQCTCQPSLIAAIQHWPAPSACSNA
ncbi:MAG: acetylxylan esterase [Pirellulaceae bacterium]|nr:acetylxylan esterase [Pirellulaceae bacterium]